MPKHRHALHPGPRRSQRDPRDFHHGLLGAPSVRLFGHPMATIRNSSGTGLIHLALALFTLGIISPIEATAKCSCSLKLHSPLCPVIELPSFQDKVCFRSQGISRIPEVPASRVGFEEGLAGFDFEWSRGETHQVNRTFQPTYFDQENRGFLSRRTRSRTDRRGILRDYGLILAV